VRLAILYYAGHTAQVVLRGGAVSGWGGAWQILNRNIRTLKKLESPEPEIHNGTESVNRVVWFWYCLVFSAQDLVVGQFGHNVSDNH